MSCFPNHRIVKWAYAIRYGGQRGDSLSLGSILPVGLHSIGSVLPVWLHFGIWDQSYLWDYIRREYTSGRRAWGSDCPYTSHSEVRPCCPCSRCSDLPFLLSGRGPHRNNNGQPCCYIHSLSKWLNVSFFIWNLIYCTYIKKKPYIWTSIFHWHNILPSSTWSQKLFWFFFSYFHFHQPRMSINADLPILLLVSHSIITLLSLITFRIFLSPYNHNIPICLLNKEIRK